MTGPLARYDLPSMSKTALPAFLIALVVAAPAVDGCRKAGDPVRGTLDAVVRAVEKGDADGVARSLSGSFHDAQGTGKAEVQLTLKRYLAAYEGLSVSLGKLEITRSPELARATFRATVSGTPRKIGGLDGILPRSTSLEFEVTLAPEDGTWRLTWASWREVQPSGL